MPDYIHKSVMLSEVLCMLNPKAGGYYADGTIGGGGHAEAILEASSPTGWLYGCDRDGAAVEAGRERLARYAGRFELRQMNFSDMAEWVPESSCDGVLLDLGVSSPQLDWAERGFSFQQDGPLDMRMDTRQAQTAADMVNMTAPEELARVFRDYGDEPEARRIARGIARARETAPIRTTRELAELIEKISPRRGKRTHPATRVFQALRMAVNDELNALERGLSAGLKILRPGGRLAVITFHSAEDRIVKAFGRERARDYTYPGDVDVPELRQPRIPEVKLVTRKAARAGDSEVAENPRSRSAQLRVMEKI